MTSTLTELTRLRIVLTWCMALLVVNLHVACVTLTPRRISGTSNQAKKPLAQQKVCCLQRFIVSALNLGAWLRWILAKCRHTLPSTIHGAEGYVFYRFLEI